MLQIFAEGRHGGVLQASRAALPAKRFVHDRRVAGAKARKALELSFERFVWIFGLGFVIFVLNAFRHRPDPRAAHGLSRGLLLPVLQSTLHLCRERAEGFGLVRGQVGQHLAIHFNARHL